jgi:hypothetical protein
MSVFEGLDWNWVKSHFALRLKMSRWLSEMLTEENVSGFARLAVGETDPSGNYSASEHGLDPYILSENLNIERNLFNLGRKFLGAATASEIPELIRRAQIKYLQIGVGSEMSCMVNPNLCWVANTKTIWSHLVVANDFNVGTANQALTFYRVSDSASPMAYPMWAAIHAEMRDSMMRICEIGQDIVPDLCSEISTARFLWADAISCKLYDEYHQASS